MLDFCGGGGGQEKGDLFCYQVPAGVMKREVGGGGDRKVFL